MIADSPLIPTAAHDAAFLFACMVSLGVAWQLPKPLEGSTHLFKYRLFYGYAGQRVIGYDNERGKGDHKHYYASETPYTFTTPEQVWADSVKDILTERGKS